MNQTVFVVTATSQTLVNYPEGTLELGIVKNMKANKNDMFDKLFGIEKPSPKEGKWKEFNKYAVLISVGHYLHGIKHGHWKEYYDTGELMLEENYENGVMHGRFATYYHNGNLMSEGTYRRGNREGYFKIYDEAGGFIKSLFFVENNLIEEVTVECRS